MKYKNVFCLTDNVDKNDGESKNNDKERETKQRVPFNEGQSSMVPLGIIKYTVPLANRQVPQLSDPSKRRHKIHEDGIIKRSGVKTVNEFNGNSNIFMHVFVSNLFLLINKLCNNLCSIKM